MGHLRIKRWPWVAIGGHGWPWVARSSGVAESGRLVRRMSTASIRPRLPKKLEPCGWMPFSGFPDGPFRWGIYSLLTGHIAGAVKATRLTQLGSDGVAILRRASKPSLYCHGYGPS